MFACFIFLFYFLIDDFSLFIVVQYNSVRFMHVKAHMGELGPCTIR